MSPREAFKAGFLARLIDDGCDLATIEKHAQAALEKTAGVLSSLVDAGKTGLTTLYGTAVPLAILAPPVAGGLGGLALAKATDVDDTDVKDLQDRELIDEYRRQASRLRRSKAVRDFRAAAPFSRSRH